MKMIVFLQLQTDIITSFFRIDNCFCLFGFSFSNFLIRIIFYSLVIFLCDLTVVENRMIFYILTCSDAFPCIWKIRLEQSFHCKKCSFNVCTIPTPELCKDIFENHDIVHSIFLQIKPSAATLTSFQELFSLQRKYLFNNFFLQYHQQAKF